MLTRSLVIFQIRIIARIVLAEVRIVFLRFSYFSLRFAALEEDVMTGCIFQFLCYFDFNLN